MHEIQNRVRFYTHTMTLCPSTSHQASPVLLFLLRGSAECLISSHHPTHIQTKIKSRDASLLYHLCFCLHSSLKTTARWKRWSKKPWCVTRTGCNFKKQSKVAEIIAKDFSPSELMQDKRLDLQYVHHTQTVCTQRL